MIAWFADTTEWFGVADMLEGKDGIQRDLHPLERLQRWAHVNLLKFNKVNCKALHMGQDKPKLKYRLRDGLRAALR